MSEISIDVLAERLKGYAARVDDAMARGSKRMDVIENRAKDTADALRKEQKDEVAAVAADVKALREDFDKLVNLKGKAQGWLGGVLFVVALFGGSVGAFFKSIIDNSN
ncbi:MAG: hypothetical protein RLZZ157_98 [Pseudomonadota bacterium]|jgi:hypothetical protein